MNMSEVAYHVGPPTLRWQETSLSGQATYSHNVALFPFQAFGWSVW